jgi:L-seryl-tRNA(Ser) seleniumtransferase
VDVAVTDTESTIGGGSLPGQTLPSCALSLASARIGVDAFARVLRLSEPGVFARVSENRVLLDLRTVLPEDDERLGGAVLAALTKIG